MLGLYTALIGSLRMSHVATGAVLAIYGLTWVNGYPLPRRETLILTNLSLATIVISAAARAILRHHRRLMATLHGRTCDLRAQAEENARLNAVIAHDIRNPLTALMGTVDLAELNGAAGPADLATIGQMAKRIEAIVNSAGALAAPADGRIRRTAVTVASLIESLRLVFGARLARKGQTLEVRGDLDLRVRTNPDILCSSVLGNVLGNAIKFSPPRAAIEIAVARHGGEARVDVLDGGRGLPADVLGHVARGEACRSQEGTDGEAGSGHGLQIATYCAQRLGGRLEADNRPGGGTVVSVFLPLAEQEDE
jgi:signal transduction histidine kinase